MRYNLIYLALDESNIPVLTLIQYSLSSQKLNHMKFKNVVYIIVCFYLDYGLWSNVKSLQSNVKKIYIKEYP